VTREAFEDVVAEGIERIPENFRRHLKDIAVVVEDRSTAAQQRRVRARHGAILLGLYEGTPRTERQYLPFVYPEKITLFQTSFEQICGDDVECIREEVAHTVWHELAHALGIPERRVRELERKRGRMRG
jgi:predicted Zn-dependent protease with MMP-like domain